MRNDPIFVLSPVWRSGSTLIQRVLNNCTDPNGRRAVIWGEHGKGRVGLVTHLFRALEGFRAQWDVGGEAQNRQRIDGAGDFWMANMCPPRQQVRSAMAGFLEAIYAADGARWGFKEVRYGKDELEYLNLIFPESRFVFMVRHPIDCIKSYIGTGWTETTPIEMAKEWNRIVPHYVRFAVAEKSRASYITYEQFGVDHAIDVAAKHGLQADRKRIETVMGTWFSKSPESALDPALEQKILGICAEGLKWTYPQPEESP